uniref:Uncharacterized protein n=1 Tax=Salix viminalis TaxID=40686 RepID=A0A6N2NIA2_SALVM
MLIQQSELRVVILIQWQKSKEHQIVLFLDCKLNFSLSLLLVPLFIIPPPSPFDHLCQIQNLFTLYKKKAPSPRSLLTQKEEI